MLLTPEERAYTDLANAIVVQAANDYRSALKGNDVEGKPPKSVLIELECFFRSDWYRMLTKVDPEYLMKQLRKEHRENMRKERVCKSN